MNNRQVMHAVGIDDAYKPTQILAKGPYGKTELVTLDGSGPYVRKRIPSEYARRGVWAMLPECNCARLPRVEATYEMPEEFVVVCDYVPGQNLKQLVESQGPYDEKNAREIVAQVCEAATALHEHSIVHRDISARNVVMAPDGAHLIDLGNARFKVEGATHDTNKLGTLGFAAPEQYGFAPTDARSDVYSLGRLFGYLLTGVEPESDDFEQAMADRGQVSPAARAIVERASAMEPSARYQSAEELAAVLRREGPTVPSATSPEPVPVQPTPEASASALLDGKKRSRPFSLTTKVILAVAVVSALVVLALASLMFLRGLGPFGGQADSVADAGDSSPVVQNEPQVEGQNEPDTTPTAEPDATAASNALEVVESGWSIVGGGYVSYAFGLHNSGDVQIDLPGVTITGRDENGQVLFSQDQYLIGIPAGETAYFGFSAGNGEAPATVEFTPIAPKEYQMGASTDAMAKYSVSGVRAVSNGYGGTHFVGEVTTEQAASGSAYDSGQVMLTLVLRDESGAIIYGDTGYATAAPVGQSTAFEIQAIEAPDDYTSFEVYAQ